MSNSYFQFKQFIIHQDRCAMKVCTDSCLFGAWVASKTQDLNRVLDIGAGTGLLMLMIAQKSRAIIDGIEIEDNCYRQLVHNIGQSVWTERMQATHADARQVRYEYKYDLVISNPPFFSNDLKSDSASAQLAKHSTRLVLDELFGIALNTGAPQSMFALLMPAHRSGEAEEIASRSGYFIHSKSNVHQTPDHKAFRVMYMFSKEAADVPFEERIDIKVGTAYSPRFQTLLQEYYLFL